MGLIQKSKLLKRLACYLIGVNELQLDWALNRLVKAPMYYYENGEQKNEGLRPSQESGRTGN